MVLLSISKKRPFASAFGGIINGIRRKFGRIYIHELFWFAIIGLLLRLVLLPYFSTLGDPYFWARGLIFFDNGYDPYVVHLSVYPPFIYLLDSPLFRLASWLGLSGSYFSFVPGLNGSPATPVFLTLWKLPLICFDFLTGFLLYNVVKKLSSNPKLPSLAFAIWVFNPLNLVITYMHGAWDITVGFFVLLGIFLMFNEDYLISGLCFGLGALAKLAPIYLLVPFSLLILLQGSKNSSLFGQLKKNFLIFLGFCFGFILPFLVCAPLILSYGKLMSYLPFSSSGDIIWNDLNQWFFAAHPVGFQLVNSHIDIIQKLPFLSVVISVLIVLLLYKRDKIAKLTIEKLLLFGSLFGVISYIFYPSIVQPQYLLWYLPLLLGLLVVYKKFRLPVAIISVAGILYYFASQGLVTPLAPLAAYSTVFSVQQYVAGLNWFYNLPYMITGASFQKDLAFVAGLVCFIGFLLVLFRGVNILWRKDE